MATSEISTTAKLPVGAKALHRKPVTEASFELARQLACRGASENLVRAIGGEAAVKKLMSDDQTVT